jgi:hypothetical protein
MVLSGSKAGHRREPVFRDEALRVLSDDGLEAAWSRYWAPLFGPDAHDSVVARGQEIAARQGASAIAAGVRAFHGRPVPTPRRGLTVELKPRLTPGT